MNSAPVQLLPIDNGSGYKSTLKETEASESSAAEKKRFAEVFEKASAGEESQQTAPEAESVKKPAKKESAKSRKETAALAEDKSGDDSRTEEAAVSGPISVNEKAVEKLKKGLKDGKSLNSSRISEGRTDTKNEELELVKRAVDKARKVSAESSGKAGPESAAAGLAVGGSLQNSGETVPVRKARKDDGEMKIGLSAKLKDAAGKAEKAAASIKLASADKQPAEAGIALQSAQKGAARKATGKLKIHDHRKTATGFSQSVKASSEARPAEAAAGGETDFSGKMSELAAGDSRTEMDRADIKQADTRSLQSSVLSQLKDELNSQIVKQAGILVKGDGTGEIKLVMKPESLGKVRIQLSLNDNHIAGRIIVENNIVREIFESNLENLYKAFGSEGFENGGLEVSVQGQGRNPDGNGRRNGRSYSGRAVQVMEDAVPELADSEWRNNAVNMVV